MGKALRSTCGKQHQRHRSRRERRRGSGCGGYVALPWIPLSAVRRCPDDKGQFSFSGLAPGKFKFTVASTGFEPYASSEIILYPSQKLILPEIRLSPGATTTDVQVSVTQIELATEQLHVQEQQRVLGIFPNFYSSYIWDAAPLSSGQKYQLAAHSLVDPFSFVGTGFFAAAEQWQNTFPGYGRARKATLSDMARPTRTRH